MIFFLSTLQPAKTEVVKERKASEETETAAQLNPNILGGSQSVFVTRLFPKIFVTRLFPKYFCN